MKKRLLILGCVLALALSLIGCGGGGDPETYTVSGTVVLHNGDAGEATPADVSLTFSKEGDQLGVVYPRDDDGDGSWTWSKSGLSGKVTITPTVEKYEGYTFNYETYEVEGAEVNIAFVGTHSSALPYTVSGYVRDEDGNAVEGACIAFSNGTDSVTTDEQGYWEKELIGPANVSIAETDAHVFEPAAIPVSAARNDVNFTAYIKYTATGTVKTGDVNVPGAVVRLTGAFGTKAVATNASGAWTMPGLYKTATVSVEKQDYDFGPAKEVNRSQTVTDFNGTYKVRGYVRYNNGVGVSDVNIQITGVSQPVSTDANGYWEKSGLAGTVTIEPLPLTEYGFDPPRRTRYSPAECNFTAREKYTGSGTITCGGEPIGYYVDITLSGICISGTETIRTAGHWQRDDLYGDVEVTPQCAGFKFTPAYDIINENEPVANFTATYSASGRFYGVDGGYIQEGTVINIELSGDMTGERLVDIGDDGYWQLDGLVGTVTLRPLWKPLGCEWNPATRTVDGPSGSLDFQLIWMD